MPAVAVLSQREVQELFLEEQGEFELTDEVRHVQAALSLLGLVEPVELTPESQVQVSTEGLLGFYSASANALVVIDADDFDYRGVEANGTLGHEFLHALQHADFDLEKYRKRIDESYDAELAATTLLEGEATFFGRFLETELEGIDHERVDWPAFYDELTDAADEYVKDEPAPETTAFQVFPYTYGPHTSIDLWRKAGLAGLAKAREERTPTTLAHLGRRHQVSLVRISAPEAVEALTPAGFELFGVEKMGSWIVHGFVSHALGEEATPRLALEWRGDSLSVFGSDEASALIWEIEWETEATARVIAEAVSARRAPGPGLWGAYPRGTSTFIYGVSRGTEQLLAVEAASRGEVSAPTAGGGDPPDAGTGPNARYDREAGHHALSTFLKGRVHSCIRD
jgi:hypothetical protein